MMNTIVVGVDGSAGATTALRFAIDEARARNAAVKAVSAWHVPISVFNTGMVPVAIDPHDFEKAAQAALDKALADVDDAGVSVVPIVRKGNAADVLVAESRGAELLVVGSRGFGGFTGLLLGSVSQQCAHHATCPVAIVPNGDRTE